MQDVICEHCGGSGAVVGFYADSHEDTVECIESLRDKVRILERRLAELEAKDKPPLPPPHFEVLTTVEAVTDALLLADSQVKAVRRLLHGKAVSRGVYRTADVVAACKQVEADPDTTTVEAVTNERRFTSYQVRQVKELLKGRWKWRDRYRLVDVLEACRDVERAEGRFEAA